MVWACRCLCGQVETALRLFPKPPVLFNAHSGCDRYRLTVVCGA